MICFGQATSVSNVDKFHKPEQLKKNCQSNYMHLCCSYGYTQGFREHERSKSIGHVAAENYDSCVSCVSICMEIVMDFLASQGIRTELFFANFPYGQIFVLNVGDVD